MKKDKRFSLRLRTYYLLIIAIVVIISFGAVVGALTALQQLGVIGHINVSTLVALLLVAAAASGSASFLVGRRVLAPMVKLSKASREVARGNYSITVEDPSKLEEVQTTLRNFNALVREMNRINNVTNDFVSSVSHEFKTPLTAIEGYAMLLQDTGLTQAERDEYLDKILYNTHRLSTLVGNILMLSKLENQSLSDQRSTFRLDEQLRQAVVMLEPQWEEKSLSFRAELDAVSISITCEPAATLKDFSSDNIKAVNILFNPGIDFENLRSKAEFNLVTSRAIQAASLKAVKENKDTVDLAALKKGDSESPDEI